MKDAHTRIPGGIFIADGGTTVGRAVVDQDYFIVVKGLSENAVYTVAKISLCVIYRYDNTQKRGSRHKISILGRMDDSGHIRGAPAWTAGVIKSPHKLKYSSL